MVTKTGAEIWRDYETDGVPASGAHNITKADMRDWMADVEAASGGATFTDIASASTTNLGSVTSTSIRITGTTTITSFGTSANLIRYVLFAASLTLTHNASTLILPGSQDIVTAAGDYATFVSDASGNWRCAGYVRRDGQHITTGSATIASATSTDLGSKRETTIDVTGTTTITGFGSSAATGAVKFVKFAASLTLTYNGTSLILPGALNIVTAAGDCLVARHEGSGNWRVLTYQRADGHGLPVALSTIASATTTDLGSVLSQAVTVSGTTTITGLGSSAPTGAVKFVVFSGALTLTHNATSLIIPGAANITTAAGDCMTVQHEGSGNWRVLKYERADAHPRVAGQTTIASGTTTDLGSAISQSIVISGTTTITGFGSSAPTGAVKFVQFSGALTLTHNATSLILPGGASILTAAGDCLIARHEGSGNWRVLAFTFADTIAMVARSATVASATTTDLGSTLGQAVTVSGTTTITGFGSTAPTGAVKFVYFSGALQITHNGTSLILPGAASITTAAGDCIVARHEGSGNWRVLAYMRAAGRPLNSGVYDRLAAGFDCAPFNAGTKSTGTFTPDPASGNQQYAVNGGAHTLAPPSNPTSMVVEYTNNASAGSVTTSGFTKVDGDALTTTNGHKFLFFITKSQTYSHLYVKAMQ